MKKFVLLSIAAMLCILGAQEASSTPINIGGGVSKTVRNFKEIRTENVVKQTLDYSCGPASLATLLTYYFQDKVSERDIIKFLLITVDLEKIKEKKGFSLLDLKNFAKWKGYEVVGYKMDLEYLVSLDKPVLIPIAIKDYLHFVIFRGLKGNRVFLADPALGKMTMKVERFLSLWQDGIGLEVSKSGKKVLNPPLELSKEEEAVFADPEVVRRIFGMDIIGKIYGDGEF